MTAPKPANQVPFPFDQASTTIIATGLLSGFLDALAATVLFIINGGREPLKIFAYIASGAFGPPALEGSATMILMGFVFHFFIAFSFTVFYFLIYPHMRFLGKSWALSGIVYGMFVWIVMNFAVIPLSRIPAYPFRLIPAVRGMIVIILMIGLPIAFMVNRYNAYRSIRISR